MSDNINDEYFDFKILKEFDLVKFIEQNKHLKPESFLLHSKYNTKKLNWYLAEQLKVYPKAVNKLPTFLACHCWFTGKSYEQSSSESSALFKSNLFKGTKFLDLSGGLGVDDWAFGKSFEEVISLDPDSNLNELVRMNWQRLSTTNCSRIDTTAEAFLNANQTAKYDLIYLDADRRSNENRHLAIQEGTPNFFEIQPKIFELSNQVLLKLSPLIDINYCKKELPFIACVWIISIQQEVKEVLCLLDKQSSKIPEIQVIEIDKKGQIHPLTQVTQETRIADEKNTTSTHEIFFEPSAALIKSGLATAYMNKFNFKGLSSTSLYFTGNKTIPLLENYGRFFKLIHQSTFSKSLFQAYLKLHKIEKMNISTRNFGMDADSLVKSLKLKTGGDNYFFFSKNQSGEKQFFHCRKLNN